MYPAHLSPFTQTTQATPVPLLPPLPETVGNLVGLNAFHLASLVSLAVLWGPIVLLYPGGLLCYHMVSGLPWCPLNVPWVGLVVTLKVLGGRLIKACFRREAN